jgi:hypothetical protein
MRAFLIFQEGPFSYGVSRGWLQALRHGAQRDFQRPFTEKKCELVHTFPSVSHHRF